MPNQDEVSDYTKENNGEPIEKSIE